MFTDNSVTSGCAQYGSVSACRIDIAYLMQYAVSYEMLVALSVVERHQRCFAYLTCSLSWMLVTFFHFTMC